MPVWTTGYRPRCPERLMKCSLVGIEGAPISAVSPLIEAANLPIPRYSVEERLSLRVFASEEANGTTQCSPMLQVLIPFGKTRREHRLCHAFNCVTLDRRV